MSANRSAFGGVGTPASADVQFFLFRSQRAKYLFSFYGGVLYIVGLIGCYNTDPSRPHLTDLKCLFVFVREHLPRIAYRTMIVKYSPLLYQQF